eukprot:CAMPEP_0119555332 /NCGR_PEP_ID=MMETSP1352-20130426/7587_1 /TAXON_ID=265584 /ORGANISM="Stauroneis constricta, Strain CCMP1120" /LENGTH=327 /DNA_ID=CAMNT_0007602081 /DNA_START=74 /DNA_END=1060 /DNA_ORIENTATION=-
MFQRRKQSSLPTSSLSVPTGGGGGGGLGATYGSSSSQMQDGSGKAIKMDAPIVKAWKGASIFTKGSYYFLILFLFLIFMGYRYLRSWNASIWLTCHVQECELSLTPPGSRTQKFVFSRRQLVSAHAVKMDKAGNFVEFDTNKYEPPQRGNKNKKKKGSYTGPDEDGNFRSYGLKLLKESENQPDADAETEAPDGDFSAISKYLVDQDDGSYMLYMRQFGLSQSRTRVRSNVNKVESYVRKRRQKLVIKENAKLPWQGILCLVFGLMGIMLTLLVGQFWDEGPKKHSGPGARRQQPLRRPPPGKDSKFYIDTGRPSKYPKGYYPGMKK